MKKSSFNKEVESEICAMYAEDQELKIDSCIDAGLICGLHSQSLKEIITEFDLPKLALVGLKRSPEMRLLLQHQDTDLEFQQMCFRGRLKKI